MRITLIIIIIILTLVSFLLAVRLALYRRQAGHIAEELFMLDREDTGYRLSSYCRVGRTEEIITHFNKIMEKYRTELVALRRENRTYRESITSISHDIRTPLTSAKGYLQMLSKDTVSAEKRQEYIRTVERRVDDVADMLNQLFAYARVEAGELEFEMERLNPANLFADTLSMFYDDFAQKGCEPKVEIAAEACCILADRHAFVRIIENLIKNALVHGTGEYAFCLKRKDGKVCLSASNRTDSIEDGDMERIFERFYTTDVSRTRKTTGLGLAIVKQFTEHMDGTVSASLEKDRFTVEISFPELTNRAFSDIIN